MYPLGNVSMVARECRVARSTVLKVEIELQSFERVVNPREIGPTREHGDTIASPTVLTTFHQCNRIRMKHPLKVPK